MGLTGPTPSCNLAALNDVCHDLMPSTEYWKYFCRPLTEYNAPSEGKAVKLGPRGCVSNRTNEQARMADDQATFGVISVYKNLHFAG